MFSEKSRRTCDSNRIVKRNDSLRFDLVISSFFSFQHEFIRNAKDLSVLQQMIDEVREIQQTSQFVQQNNATSIHPGLTERPFGLENTLTNRNNDETIQSTRHRSENDHSDTFQSSSCNTMIELSSESSDTMIINETETENDVDSQQDTLKMKTSLPNNLKSSYLNAHQGKRSTNNNNNNNVDRTKETFMKSIAQEVRLYNQNSDDFQRVKIFCRRFCKKKRKCFDF